MALAGTLRSTLATNTIRPELMEEQPDNINRSIEIINDTVEKAVGPDQLFYIGSLPREIYMGQDPPSVSDLDLIIPSIPQGTVEDVSQQINNILTSIGISLKADTSLSSILRILDGQYFLYFGKTRVPIDKELFTPVFLNHRGTSFRTFLPDTLLHMWTFTGNQFRSKDWKNAMNFARFIRENELYSFPHEAFKPFHKFQREVLRAHPLKKAQIVWRQGINNLPPAIRKKLLRYYPYTKPIRKAVNTIIETT